MVGVIFFLIIIIGSSLIGFFIDSLKAVKEMPVKKAMEELGNEVPRSRVVSEDPTEREIESVYESVIKQLREDRIARAERLGELYVLVIILIVGTIVLGILFWQTGGLIY